MPVAVRTRSSAPVDDTGTPLSARDRPTAPAAAPLCGRALACTRPDAALPRRRHHTSAASGARGASAWEWASNVPDGEEPDVVLGCAGDIPTLETVAAAHWLRRNAPGLTVRVVNVVDLMALFPREFHPHGMDETRFVELFTADKPVVFAFHGYQRAIHEIVHGHVDVDRFHVRGFNKQGTTTTPFEMTVLNGMSRYHLAAEALRRSAEYPNSRSQARTPTLISECEALISKASAYAREYLEDPPEIRGWRWNS